MYLVCYTQEEIANELSTDVNELTHQTVSNVLEKFTKNGETAKIGKDFEPKLYDIWNFANCNTNKVKHPGMVPQEYLRINFFIYRIHHFLLTHILVLTNNLGLLLQEKH